MRAPPFNRLTLALPVLLALASAGCGGSRNGAPPLSSQALAAVIEQPGVNREALARAVDRLFDAETMGETRAILVLRNGRVVAQRYGAGYHENTRFVSWSMAKTVTGVLIGMLVSDGRLRLDDSAPIPAWQRPGDPRGEITLRQLLQMRSGLHHVEAGEPVYESDEVRMLFGEGRDNMAAYAEAQPLENEPGSKWKYSTATTIILADIAARALTTSPDPEVRRGAVSDYLHARLLEPVGMASAVPEYDRAGTLIGGSMIHATARDWARMGEFLRNKGAVKGAQLVPAAWIAFMTSPSPRSAGYGAQTWLNHPQDDGHIEFPGAPPSAFSMNGHLGQFVLVVPDRGLTIVRLGKTAEGHHEPVRAALGSIAALFPVKTEK